MINFYLRDRKKSREEIFSQIFRIEIQFFFLKVNSEFKVSLQKRCMHLFLFLHFKLCFEKKEKEILFFIEIIYNLCRN
jgi:hypothetical protein